MSKKKRNHEGSQSHATTEASSPPPTSRAPRSPRKPTGTVAERLVDKADHIHTLTNDALRLLTKRGAPTDVRTATQTFLGQVEAWRETIFGLKSTGWQPVETAANKEIVEGDVVQIVPEQATIYQYIFDALRVTAGEEKLVAGTVIAGKRSTRVLVCRPAIGTPGDVDDQGKSIYVSPLPFGFVPRNHLVKR